MREALAFDERRGIVLAGLAGVGKTRLARAAADAAAQAGHVVRRVAGTASGRTVTLGAFARWVEDTDPSPVAMARKVFAGLTAEADGAPLLLFVDDAHLLDDLSAGWEADGLRLGFTLPAGSYATVLLREVMKAAVDDEPAAPEDDEGDV